MKNPTAPAAPKRGKPKRSAEGRETAGTLTIRLVRSGICTPRDQKLTLKALGLTRREQEVVRADHPAIRGMIHKVRHLVEVQGRSER
jgi:large subunit ribosomal protein L30